MFDVILSKPNECNRRRKSTWKCCIFVCTEAYPSVSVFPISPRNRHHPRREFTAGFCTVLYSPRGQDESWGVTERGIAPAFCKKKAKIGLTNGSCCCLPNTGFFFSPPIVGPPYGIPAVFFYTSKKRNFSPRGA